MCNVETSRLKMPWPALGRSATKKVIVEKFVMSRKTSAAAAAAAVVVVAIQLKAVIILIA